MLSLSQKISTTTQPKDGYLPLSLFTINQMQDTFSLYDSESLDSHTLELAVTYISKYAKCNNKKSIFRLCLESSISQHEEINAYRTLRSIDGIDDISLTNACKMVQYLVPYDTPQITELDDKTIRNLRIMVVRTIMNFPLVSTCGYPCLCTKDTLVSIVPIRGEITIRHTLQALCYYVGCSNNQSIQHITIYNPRLNKSYTCNVSDIDIDSIAYATYIISNSKCTD